MHCVNAPCSELLCWEHIVHEIAITCNCLKLTIWCVHCAILLITLQVEKAVLSAGANKRLVLILEVRRYACACMSTCVWVWVCWADRHCPTMNTCATLHTCRPRPQVQFWGVAETSPQWVPSHCLQSHRRRRTYSEFSNWPDTDSMWWTPNGF